MDGGNEDLIYSGLAQLAVQLILNQKALGSNPRPRTKPRKIARVGLKTHSGPHATFNFGNAKFPENRIVEKVGEAPTSSKQRRLS